MSAASVINQILQEIPPAHAGMRDRYKAWLEVIVPDRVSEFCITGEFEEPDRAFLDVIMVTPERYIILITFLPDQVESSTIKGESLGGYQLRLGSSHYDLRLLSSDGAQRWGFRVAADSRYATNLFPLIEQLQFAMRD